MWLCVCNFWYIYIYLFISFLFLELPVYCFAVLCPVMTSVCTVQCLTFLSAFQPYRHGDVTWCVQAHALPVKHPTSHPSLAFLYHLYLRTKYGPKNLQNMQWKKWSYVILFAQSNLTKLILFSSLSSLSQTVFQLIWSLRDMHVVSQWGGS